MNGYALTPLAEADVGEILDRIVEQDGRARAGSFLSKLLSSFERVARAPSSGHARPDLTERHVLFWSVHRHLVVYDPEAVPLLILRVLHGARDPRELRDDLGP